MVRSFALIFMFAGLCRPLLAQKPEQPPESKEKPAPGALPQIVLLAEPAGAIRVGGAGRLLIVHLPKARQLAVLDLNAEKIVKYLPIVSEQPLFAAGKYKLLVVYPETKTVVRYSLETFEKEATALLSTEGNVVAAGMGSASAGPLLIAATTGPAAAELLTVDVATLKKISSSPIAASLFPKSKSSVAARLQMHLSADGRFLALACARGNGQSVSLYAVGLDLKCLAESVSF